MIVIWRRGNDANVYHGRCGSSKAMVFVVVELIKVEKSGDVGIGSRGTII